VIALFLLGFVLAGADRCEAWQIASVENVAGVDVDSATLATATFTVGHAMYHDELQGRLDALPPGTRCYLGQNAEDVDETMPVTRRLSDACGLDCPSRRVLPLMPNADARVLHFASYRSNPSEYPGTLSYPRFGCVPLPVVRQADGRWRVHHTTADAPRVPPRRPDAAASTARAYWQKHECPYEHLLGLGDAADGDEHPDIATLVRANAELDEARRSWQPGQTASAECLAKRFALFSDGDVDGKDVEWVGREAKRQIVDVALALEAADALAKLRPLEPWERIRLPELWARLPLGIRAPEMCAALRSKDRLDLWSTTLALAVLVHCPDALRDPDGRLPKVMLPMTPHDDTPDGTQSLRDLLTPMCWATLASLRF